MPSLLVALASGLLFGLGLTVSSMIDPAKVLSFLDIAGNWDPSLAFVMLAAIPVTAIGFAIAGRRGKPLIETFFRGPTATAIDRRLVLGSLLFGVGWGLVGYCPGPALAALGLGNPATWLFVAAMLAGMASYELIQSLLSRRAQLPDTP
jgi:uncharacterized membrane protein YedE/YeeE